MAGVGPWNIISEFQSRLPTKHLLREGEKRVGRLSCEALDRLLWVSRRRGRSRGEITEKEGVSPEAHRGHENDSVRNGANQNTGRACPYPTVVKLATECVVVNRQVAGHIVMGLELLTGRWGGVKDRRNRSGHGDQSHHGEASQPL